MGSRDAAWSISVESFGQYLLSIECDSPSETVTCPGLESQEQEKEKAEKMIRTKKACAPLCFLLRRSESLQPL